jgi:hypothetical protein
MSVCVCEERKHECVSRERERERERERGRERERERDREIEREHECLSVAPRVVTAGSRRGQTTRASIEIQKNTCINLHINAYLNK